MLILLPGILKCCAITNNNVSNCTKAHRISKQFFFVFVFFLLVSVLSCSWNSFLGRIMLQMSKKTKKHPQATIFSVIRSSSNLLILSKFGSESSYKGAERSWSIDCREREREREREFALRVRRRRYVVHEFMRVVIRICA